MRNRRGGARSGFSCGLVEKRALPAPIYTKTWNIFRQNKLFEPEESQQAGVLCGMETEQIPPVSICTPLASDVDDCSKECKLARRCSVAAQGKIALRETSPEPGRSPISGCIKTGLRARGCGYCSFEERGCTDVRPHQYGSWSNETRENCELQGIRSETAPLRLSSGRNHWTRKHVFL